MLELLVEKRRGLICLVVSVCSIVVILSQLSLRPVRSQLVENVTKDTCAELEHIREIQEKEDTQTSAAVNISLDNEEHWRNLDSNQQSLPQLELLRDWYRTDHMDLINTFFFDADSLHTRKSISDFGYMGMVTKIHTIAYNDVFYHKYDNYRDLKASGGPHADQELCIRELTNLTQRAQLQKLEKYTSKDVNFHQFIDTYGRTPPGMLLGHSVFTGMYTECLRLKIKQPTGDVDLKGSDTRYCVVTLKLMNWADKEVLSKYTGMKAGICMPRSCDSTNYKNKWSLILELFRFNLREMDRDQAVISDFYCLPDEDSSLRIWWKSRSTMAFVGVLAIWLAVLTYSTVRYEKQRKLTKTSKALERTDSSFGLTSGFQTDVQVDAEAKVPDKQVASHPDPYIKVFQSLSVIHNLEMLFNTTKASALMEVSDVDTRGSKETEEEEMLIKKMKPIVDLRVLEGIKVLCMCYVIMSHVLMCLTLVVANGRELTSVGSNNVSVFIANLVPAFAVNAFFTITGILTTYFLFKNKQSKSLINDGKKWFAMILYRYLRIMPMYVVVVAYTKYLAKFMGEGPFWDYATSAMSARGKCEQESWLWSLLFGANFKSPLDHCIPSAWYLANDFQFFIVTPIFLAALHRSPAFGRQLLKICIIAGYLAGFVSILVSDAEDVRPVVSFEPHGFKTYVTFLSASYTRPQYRIPAYLCGLLIGFALYQFEQNKIKYLLARIKETGAREATSYKEPDWSESFKKYGLLFSILSVVSCCALPFLGSFLHFNKFFAKILLALFMSSYHLMFSLSVGLYVLLSTTGYCNNFLNTFLSSSFWKPLARLSLCVVLINVEVVIYVLHNMTQMFYLTFNSHMATNLVCVVYTYLIAIAVCVLFEAPMRALLNDLLRSLMIRAAAKKKIC